MPNLRQFWNWLRGRSDKLFLSAFALIGAVLGLANTLLAWQLYGSGADADIWMLALTATTALCLLSQLGVEQFPVFSAQMHASSHEHGCSFDRDALTWAVGFGAIFAISLALARPSVINLFCSGYNLQQKDRVSALLLPLLFQVMFSPALFVLRQQLLLGGRPKLAIISNSLFQVVQFLVLVWAWMINGMVPERVAQLTGIISAALASCIVFLLAPKGVMRIWPVWVVLRPFIRASFAMRTIHSVHNFFVTVLTSTALSNGVEGTVALYQYVKKFADGISSISVGPHMSVYHASQARAWAISDFKIFKHNIRDYLTSALPLLFSAILLLGVFIGGAMFLDDNFAQRFPPSAFVMLITLLAWQTLISIESIPVGVLVIEKRTGVMFAINITYVSLFFMAIQYILVPPYDGASVAFASFICQVISSILYVLCARKLVLNKFKVVK